MENELVTLSNETLKDSLDKTGQILETEDISEPVLEQEVNVERPLISKVWGWIGLHDQTLIDFLKLAASIAIPFLLYQLSLRQVNIAVDNQRHEIMASYLDKMTSLMEQGLAGNTTRQAIAKAITLNATRQLDGDRKGQLLNFLYGANLIGGGCNFDSKTLSIVKGSCEQGLIKLSDAKLNETSFERPIPLRGVDLEGATLTGADMPGIDLSSANMQSARLTNGTLAGAILNNAKLQNAKLEGINLVGAELVDANLSHAYLVNADLRGADLSKANLDGANLKGAKYSKVPLEIVYPDRVIKLKPTSFPEGFVPESQHMQVLNSNTVEEPSPQ